MVPSWDVWRAVLAKRSPWALGQKRGSRKDPCGVGTGQGL